MLIVSCGVLLRTPQLAASREWMTLCIAGPLSFAIIFPRVVLRFIHWQYTPRFQLIGWLALAEIVLLAVAVTYGVNPNGALPAALAAFGCVAVIEVVASVLEHRELDAIAAAIEAHEERQRRLRDLTGG